MHLRFYSVYNCVLKDCTTRDLAAVTCAVYSKCSLLCKSSLLLLKLLFIVCVRVKDGWDERFKCTNILLSCVLQKPIWCCVFFFNQVKMYCSKLGKKMRPLRRAVLFVIRMIWLKLQWELHIGASDWGVSKEGFGFSDKHGWLPTGMGFQRPEPRPLQKQLKWDALEACIGFSCTPVFQPNEA